MSKKIIYLDQNVWIALARVHYRMVDDPKLKEVCDKLIVAIEEGNITCPLSIIHVAETLRHMNEKRRKRLAKFMVKISKGFTILPWPKVVPLEIKNAFYKRLGMDQVGISKIVIGKGMGHSFGSKSVIEGNAPEKIKEKILKKADSPETIEWFLSNQNIVNQSRDEEYDYKDFINSIEDDRKKFSKIKDINLKYDLSVANYLTSSKEVSPIVARIWVELEEELGLQKDEMSKFFQTKNQLLDFFKDIPTSFCHFSLNDRLNRDLSKPISRNDLYDIWALSIAIPYCDIVIFENRFASLAKDAKLDEEYGTKILSFSELKKLGQYF